MRNTICELPHDPAALATAWTGRCRHTAEARTYLVLLPEFAWVPPVWKGEQFESACWAAAGALSDAWLERLPAYVFTEGAE